MCHIAAINISSIHYQSRDINGNMASWSSLHFIFFLIIINTQKIILILDKKNHLLDLLLSVSALPYSFYVLEQPQHIALDSL